MAGDPQPFCDDCLVPLTMRHLLIECPSLEELRDRFLSAGKEDGVYCFRKILGEGAVFNNECDVFKFLSEAGLLHET